MTAKIMVAQEKSSLPLVVKSLASYELVPVFNLRQAKVALADVLDVCLVDIHFDDSNALDLIAYIRSVEHARHTPIVVTRLKPARQPAMLRQTIVGLRKAYNISSYLELDFDDVHRKLRESVELLLDQEKVAPAHSLFVSD